MCYTTREKQWASRWTWQHLTLSAHSTQRSESIHSTIKQFLNALTLLTHLANKIDENRITLSEQNEGRAIRIARLKWLHTHLNIR